MKISAAARLIAFNIVFIFLSIRGDILFCWQSPPIHCKESANSDIRSMKSHFPLSFHGKGTTIFHKNKFP